MAKEPSKFKIAFVGAAKNIVKPARLLALATGIIGGSAVAVAFAAAAPALIQGVIIGGGAGVAFAGYEGARNALRAAKSRNEA